MKLKRFAAFILAFAAVGACACGNGSSDKDSTEDTASAAASSGTAAESDADPEPQKEKTYTDQCADILEELAPKEMLKRRKGVEYPTFQAVTYYSTTAERETPACVLLPAGYSEDKEYPVLYILHGYWCDQTWMTAPGVFVSTMLNNLIADGKAEEMIIVCPYIYCSKEQPACTAMDTPNTLAYDNFINDLNTDLMPFIEENYSVAKGRENTAITGFSMGGREALYIGFAEPEKFGYVGAVCPAPGVIKGTGDPYNLEREQFCFTDTTPYLVMISASLKDNVVGDSPMSYHDALEENGTEHLWHTMEKTGHDASSVTPHLYNFLQMVFRAESE